MHPPGIARPRLTSSAHHIGHATSENLAAAILLMSADAQLHHQVSLVAAGLGVPLEVYPGLVSSGLWPTGGLVLMDAATAQRYTAHLAQPSGLSLESHNGSEVTGSGRQLQQRSNSVPEAIPQAPWPDTAGHLWGSAQVSEKKQQIVAIIERQPATQAVWQAAALGGIRSFFQLPQQQKQLTALATRVLRPRRSARVLATTAITPQSGATTLAECLADTLRSRLTCVLIDADPVRQGMSSHMAATVDPHISWDNIEVAHAGRGDMINLNQLPQLHGTPTLMFNARPEQWDGNSVLETVEAISQWCDLVIVDLGQQPWNDPTWRHALARAENWSFLGVAKVRSTADLTQVRQWSTHCPIAPAQCKAVIRRDRVAPWHESEVAQELHISGFHALPWCRRSGQGSKKLDHLAQRIAEEVIPLCSSATNSAWDGGTTPRQQQGRRPGFRGHGWPSSGAVRGAVA